MGSPTLFLIMSLVVNATCRDSILNRLQSLMENPLQAIVNSGLIIKCDRSCTCKEDMSQLSLWHFDENNKTTVYKMDESMRLLADSRFRRNPKMNVWIPGFTDDVDDRASANVRNAYLSRKLPLFFYRTYDYTYSNLNLAKSYERSVKYAPCSGMILAKFLCELFRGGVDIRNMHIIGHSLGGQTLGYVGRHFLKLCGRKLTRLSALDPAGLCFNDANLEHQIGAHDAEFVDIYNCNRYGLGTKYLTGTANFLPNGEGYRQPRCSNDLLGSICSHYLCVSLWAKSVRDHPFNATECSNWKNYNSGKCKGNSIQMVGYPSSNNSQGTYYFNANISAGDSYSLSEKLLKIIMNS